MTYQEQLLDPRWIRKRDQILKRDKNECQTCLATENLHVHHKQYVTGRMAWQYSGDFLITLCKSCHAKIHQKAESEFHRLEKEAKKLRPVKMIAPYEPLSVIADRCYRSLVALRKMSEATHERYNG